MLLRYRLSVTIVLGALAATTAAFVFARPQYHDPSPGRAFDLSYAKPAAVGWRWADGTPGFRFGQDEAVWNEAKLRPDDLTAARAAARPAGVDPDGIRVLTALRTKGGDLFALLAGSNARGQTCVGASVPNAPVAWSCLLDRQAAIVIVAPGAPEQTAKYGTLYPLSLLGVTRADVTRVTLDLPGVEHGTLYTRSAPLGNWWGTFAGPLEFPRPWQGALDIYGKHGRLASVPLSSGSPPLLVEP